MGRVEFFCILASTKKRSATLTGTCDALAKCSSVLLVTLGKAKVRFVCKRAFTQRSRDFGAGAQRHEAISAITAENKFTPQEANSVGGKAGGNCASAYPPARCVSRTARPNESTIADTPPEAARAIGKPSSIAR